MEVAVTKEVRTPLAPLPLGERERHEGARSPSVVIGHGEAVRNHPEQRLGDDINPRRFIEG